MDRNIRYEVLSGEEERVPAEPVVLAMVIPPQVEESTHQNSEECFGTKLPTYQEATTLPTYEEAEKSKAAEALIQSDLERQREEEHDRFTDITIGTDGMFLCTFIMSFLFNWIGFLFSLCISQTVAGRCGALSGLGLSIVKWVAIVKHNQWADGFAEEDSWLWWLLIFCGFMIFVRGAVQYARVKFEWNRFSIHGQVRRYYLF
ncbi:NEDD4 family-interacting protein 1-like [Ruditapes philippinarum]|uniref:NEDD4 family-interacting protein 1-like n=1 Tax=Ruditapes philippinarum TaxID=129788 RepID=UPI00295A800D|nr:NEDD4 family-interacting protein 1-like [Ruditapes philippinarum]